MSEQLKLHGTAEICDVHGDKVQVLQPILKSYGGKERCSGEVITISLNEDNSTLKSLLQTPGKGRVAVVNVTGEYCAVVGDTLCGFAIKNDWSGIVISGYVRDTEMLKNMPIAVWALGTCPRRSSKKYHGKLDENFKIAGVEFSTGLYLYADEDGMLLADEPFCDINFIK